MQEKAKVIAYIREQYKDRFRVFDNTGADKKVIAGQFPDMIFMQKEPPPNNNILFTFKIETTNRLVDSVSEWQALGGAPSTLYIVVKREQLDEAKKLVSATGVKAHFASYGMDDKGEIAQIRYE
ncbi:MAG TPA: hypothetical protein VF438_02230 [Candidatus Paceibacterota bacterium]